MEPYYLILRLPSEEKEEFVLLIPFTLSKKDNLGAWLAVRSDPPPLREARRLQLPQAETDLRPPADRSPDRPGPVYLPAALPLEPAGLAGDPGESPRRPHRAFPRVCGAALHRRRERAAPGAEARDRRLRGPNRHGGDARGRDGSACSEGRHSAWGPRRRRVRRREPRAQ